MKKRNGRPDLVVESDDKDCVSPERHLLSALLARALVDILDGGNFWRVSLADRKGAQRWIFQEALIGPFSFSWVVEALGLSPPQLRRLILDALKDKRLAEKLLYGLIQSRPFQCSTGRYRPRRKKGEVEERPSAS